MRVLLSAYACEPDKGSEPGIGWRWAVQIAALGHETHVLTRANNQQAIDVALETLDLSMRPRFHYFDLEPWMRFWKRAPGGVYLYNLLWQLGAARLAANLNRRDHFDLVHHLTFGSVRLPSFMGRLGIPFVFGPAGGGERAPPALRRSYPFRGQVLDALRDASNRLIGIDPLMMATFRQASLILLKTSDSLSVIPPRHRAKTAVQLETGITPPPAGPAGRPAGDGLRVLYAGRFIFWKGMHLGLKAFERLLDRHPTARLTMVGKGPDRDHWRRLAAGSKLAAGVDWIDWAPKADMDALYARHDVFLFPSLHDSSGNVILEAAANGLPIVCLDLGGPGAMVEDSFGYRVATEGKTEQAVIDDLAGKLALLAEQAALRGRMSAAARAWSREMGWAAVVRRAYALIQSKIGIGDDPAIARGVAAVDQSPGHP